jgi:hypothetical protein
MNNQKQMPDIVITASAIRNVSMTCVPRDYVMVPIPLAARLLKIAHNRSAAQGAG